MVQTCSKVEDSGHVSAEWGGCHGDIGVLVFRNWLTQTEVVLRSERACERKERIGERKGAEEGRALLCDRLSTERRSHKISFLYIHKWMDTIVFV